MSTTTTVVRKRPEDLRSHKWLGAQDLRAFGHRSRTKQMGFGPEDFAGRPVIGIINTWSDLNPCHQHFKLRVEDVKRGVWQAGGFPVELPALALPETFVKPSTMLYRNLLALETEELLRSHPIDGTVLLGGCDKTTPALVMGAVTMDLPFMFLPAGPMLRGTWRGRPLGSGTSTWKYWSELRSGAIDEAAWTEIEDGIARSFGQCMTMGTASTMTSAVDAMGLTLPGASSIPAADSRHARMAAACGRRIVQLVWDDLRPSTFLDRRHYENAVVTVSALGGSTNAVIHLVAMAARSGVALSLDDFDRTARQVPVLANIQPAGEYLMEDFFLAGGLLALLSRVGDLLHLDAGTVGGGTLGESLDGATVFDDEVIRPRARPLFDEGGIAVLRGNLAPDGCVIKYTAADPRLLRHRGRAVVFRDVRDLAARIDTEDLDVDPSCVLVLQSAGPLGGPGMPEWGMLPLPAKLLRQGVRDMVRVSDARMSGTSYGTCVLHVTPESHVGGPLALVRDGDAIELDVPARRLTLCVDDAELARRQADWRPPQPPYRRGYGALYARHVTQANLGCDFDFLSELAPTDEPHIF